MSCGEFLLDDGKEEFEQEARRSQRGLRSQPMSGEEFEPGIKRILRINQGRGELGGVSLRILNASRKSSRATRISIGCRKKDVRRIIVCTSRYSGGMKVIDLEPKSPGFNAGIRKGDILVGLHKWETQSIANIQWIINRVAEDQKPLGDHREIRYVIIRDQKSREGVLLCSWTTKVKAIVTEVKTEVTPYVESEPPKETIPDETLKPE